MDLRVHVRNCAAQRRAAASSARRRCVSLALFAILVASLSAAQAQDESPPYFQVEALNLGLDPAPSEVHRETPQEAVGSFLDLAARNNFEAAAHLLNLNEIERAKRAEQGAKLARMLYEVIERRVVIDWQDVPSRPDAVDERLPQDHAFAGTARRSLLIAALPVDDRPVPLRLNRLKPSGAEPVWVFSKQTVARIIDLHQVYGPTWFEELLPPALKAPFYSDIRTWEAFVLPLLIAVSLGLILLLRTVFRRISSRAPFLWIRRASDEVAMPLAIAVTAVILQLVTSLALSFSGEVTVVLQPALWALVIFGFTFAALKAIDATLEVVTERYVGEIDSSHDSHRRHLYTNIYALRRYVLLAAVVISTVILLHKLNLFESFGLSLLASAGVATVIFGIAGQSILGNILASLQVAIAQPIRIGDNVLYQDRWAYVESIYYTYIVLRTWDERRLIVPVKHFVSNPFENWTMLDSKLVRSFRVTLDLSAEPAVLREVYEDLVRKDKDALPDEMLLVAVEELSERSQTLGFYATAENPSDAWLMQARLAEAMGDWIRENRPHWWPKVRLDPVGTQAADSGETTPLLERKRSRS